MTNALTIILPPAPSEVEQAIAECLLLAMRPLRPYAGLTAAEQAEVATRVELTEREFAETSRPVRSKVSVDQWAAAIRDFEKAGV
jgi:hypothetical protein